MTLALMEAAKLSRDPLTRGVLSAIATSDEMVSQIPFEPMAGKATSYNREKALPTVEFVENDDTITASTATFDTVTVPLRSIVSDFDLDEFDLEQQSDENDQMAVQLEKKLKALGRTIGTKMITGGYVTSTTVLPAFGGVTVTTVGPNQDTSRMGPASLQTDGATDNLSYRGPGDVAYGAVVNITGDGVYTLYSSNPNKFVVLTIVALSLPATATQSQLTYVSTTKEWDGLLKLIPTTHAQALGNTVTDGSALTFALMDMAIASKIKTKDNLFWIGNAQMKTALLGLLRGLGGTTPEMVQLPGMSRPVPAYQGIPFLQNDNIPNTESKGGSSTLTSLFLAEMGGDGLSMYCGQRGGGVILPTHPNPARVMGVKVAPVGTVQNKDAVRTRVSFRGALKLGSELSICRIINLLST
jgi:hypothetical protein